LTKLRLVFLLNTGSFKTFLTPATLVLVAFAIVGRSIAGEIAFLGLDGFDQFGFEQIVGLNAVRSGNGPDFGDYHSVLLLPVLFDCLIEVNYANIAMPRS
jgi:hypothetical protein